MHPIFNQTIYNLSLSLYLLKKINKQFFITFYSSTCIKCYSESNIISQSSPWKVLFFGTDEFSVESLKTLHKKYKVKEIERLEVVTINNKKENAVTKYAKQNKIVVNKWPIEVNKSEFHIGIVISFGHLIPSKIINAFPLGMLNVHGSLLPRWRGASPIIYALINGDSQTGVTILKIKPKIFDVGEIILQKQVDIDEHETMPELYIKLAKLAASLLEKTFENLLESLKYARPQDETNATYAPKVSLKISLINWNEMSASNVYNLHRALLSLYPLSTSFQNVKIKLLDIQKIETNWIVRNFEGEKPGTAIYDKKYSALVIKCKEGFVSVKKIIVQGSQSAQCHE
ncbi:PREDICTED: methionyl-tRNA formyltransferase, mitochondrial [Eufriesea mexicana]|uniref:methionyl-tRNA formyltransferase, mitochondrial n=1 Tax=Eufriesea mexicana TaxID=516756 RepID=UPI00083C09A2|nr:PREDICTED: methionyl-tRNA formyltransferase, mitochondrial [Eufriesea mexicana]